MQVAPVSKRQSNGRRINIQLQSTLHSLGSGGGRLPVGPLRKGFYWQGPAQAKSQNRL